MNTSSYMNLGGVLVSLNCIKLLHSNSKSANMYMHAVYRLTLSWAAVVENLMLQIL